jgi:hypothetical protein
MVLTLTEHISVRSMCRQVQIFSTVVFEKINEVQFLAT